MAGCLSLLRTQVLGEGLNRARGTIFWSALTVRRGCWSFVEGYETPMAPPVPPPISTDSNIVATHPMQGCGAQVPPFNFTLSFISMSLTFSINIVYS